MKWNESRRTVRSLEMQIGAVYYTGSFSECDRVTRDLWLSAPRLAFNATRSAATWDLVLLAAVGSIALGILCVSNSIVQCTFTIEQRCSTLALPTPCRHQPRRHCEQETQLLLTNRATHLCYLQWRGWPLLSHTCYFAKFGRFTSTGVGISRGTPKLGNAGVSPSFAMGSIWPPKTHPSHHICYHI